jgi:hypothetical protein
MFITGDENGIKDPTNVPPLGQKPAFWQNGARYVCFSTDLIARH